MRTMVLTCLLLLLPACAFLRRVFPEPPPVGVPADSVALWGVHTRAADTALADYLAHEQSAVEQIQAEPHDDQDSEWQSNLREAECWARPEAYRLYVSLDATTEHYRVFVWPVPEVCLGEQAQAAVGGGGVYEIDARTFEITSKELME